MSIEDEIYSIEIGDIDGAVAWIREFAESEGEMPGPELSEMLFMRALEPEDWERIQVAFDEVAAEFGYSLAP